MGVDVIRDQVLASHPQASKGRFYDGLVELADGTYRGIEVKSGTSSYCGSQKRFDKKVSRDQPATAKLNGDIIQIVEVEVIHWP